MCVLSDTRLACHPSQDCGLSTALRTGLLSSGKAVRPKQPSRSRLSGQQPNPHTHDSHTFLYR